MRATSACLMLIFKITTFPVDIKLQMFMRSLKSQYSDMDADIY